MDEKQIILLLEKDPGSLTEKERLLLENWYNYQAEHSSYQAEEHIIREKLELVAARLPLINTPQIRRRIWPRIAAAAAILLIASLGIIFYTYYFAPRHSEGSAATRDLLANDIKPGTNKATLTLANGQQITLTDAANGTIANQSGIRITKTADGQVIYTMLSLAPSGRGGKAGEGNDNSNNSSLPSGISPHRGERGVALNAITTPRGGQYQIHLPDGTHVWLNASSTLKYPVSFNGSPDRKVSLTGEAYFEVAKDKKHPFKVTSSTQEVTVLGTHFNINTYPDEPDTKTTLLEGSVQVSTLHPSPLRGEVAKPVRGEQLTLKPNQQSTLKSGAFLIKTVDPQLAIAWKNNKFIFDHDDIQSIMRMIERWYNIQVIYKGEIPDRKFGGSVSRFDNISNVLMILESTGIAHFELQGRTIYVSKQNNN